MSSYQLLYLLQYQLGDYIDNKTICRMARISRRLYGITHKIIQKRLQKYDYIIVLKDDPAIHLELYQEFALEEASQQHYHRNGLRFIVNQWLSGFDIYILINGSYGITKLHLNANVYSKYIKMMTEYTIPIPPNFITCFNIKSESDNMDNCQYATWENPGKMETKTKTIYKLSGDDELHIAYKINNCEVVL